MSWVDNREFPDNDEKSFNEVSERKIKEILTRYGDICLMGFDTPLGVFVAHNENRACKYVWQR